MWWIGGCVDGLSIYIPWGLQRQRWPSLLIQQRGTVATDVAKFHYQTSSSHINLYPPFCVRISLSHETMSVFLSAGKPEKFRLQAYCVADRTGRSGVRIPMGTEFPHPSIPALGPTPSTYLMVTGSFPVVKRLWLGFNHPPHLAPRLKKE
jgi:hypothetical protein